MLKKLIKVLFAFLIIIFGLYFFTFFGDEETHCLPFKIFCTNDFQ